MTQEKALFEYLLRKADDSLIIGHRLSEWCRWPGQIRCTVQ